MTKHALLIGEMEMDSHTINEIFMEVWHDKPDQIMDVLTELEDSIRENIATAAFIRIDAVKQNGLKITRFIRDYYPRVTIVWMANGESYALSAFDEGVDAYLELPLTKEKLYAIAERFQKMELKVTKTT